MKIKSIFCGLVCLCLLSGCSGQPQQKTESSKSENITVSSNQSQSVSTPAVAEEHSSPEKAIEQYCKTFSAKNIDACKKIVPPDYLHLLEAVNQENTAWTIGGGENNTDIIRLAEFKEKNELAKGEEMYEWYLNNCTATKSTNAEKIMMYTISAYTPSPLEVPGDEGEAQDIPFICVLENGKWYAIAVS